MGNAGSGMGDMVGMGAGLAMGQQMADALKSKPSIAQTPPPPPSKENFYISLDGKANGPFDHAGLVEMITQGKLTPETFVWRQEYDGWKRADSVLSELFDHVPPPPPSH
jgi:hypothetical protein